MVAKVNKHVVKAEEKRGKNCIKGAGERVEIKNILALLRYFIKFDLIKQLAHAHSYMCILIKILIFNQMRKSYF